MYLIGSYGKQSFSLIDWNWVESSNVLNDLSHCDTGLFREMAPLFNCFFSPLSIWDSFIPDNGCIINCSHDVKNLRSRLEKHLFWPAALVPTEDHEVINSLINVTLVIEHVQELVSQRCLWEKVLKDVAERISLEQVLVLIYFGHVVITKALRVEADGGVIVDASFEASKIPMHHLELETQLSHVYKVWDILEILLFIVDRAFEIKVACFVLSKHGC